MKTQRKPLFRLSTFTIGLFLLAPLIAYAYPFSEGESGHNHVREAIFGSNLGWNVAYLGLPFVFFIGIAAMLHFAPWRARPILGPPAHDPRRWKE